MLHEVFFETTSPFGRSKTLCRGDDYRERACIVFPLSPFWDFVLGPHQIARGSFSRKTVTNPIYARPGSVQLELAPDETPDTAPGGRAALTFARRTASRRLQTSPA